jgi:hypothetical protein
MGEWSKTVGEKGEEIVNYFFNEILGYKTILSNESIVCNKGLKHKVKSSKANKTTHGIDALISAKSPLEDNLLDIGIISSKFTSSIYPNSPKTLFKEYIADLAFTIECFKNSKLYSDINQKFSNVNRTDITGILVWASNKSSQKEEIISKVSNIILDNDLVFDKIIIVDNDRINFFVETVQNAKKEFGVGNVKFVYHNSNLNTIGLQSMSYGDFLPTNYLFSNIIPIRVINKNEIEFIIFSKENFSKENFSKLLAFANSFDLLHSVDNIILSFSDYNDLTDEPIILSELLNFDHYEYGKNLFVKTHLSDFRNKKKS